MTRFCGWIAFGLFFFSMKVMALPFAYQSDTIYHIQGQFNGQMLKQYLNLSPELDGWYDQNTHRIHLTPVVKGGTTYYKIASEFGHYFSAPDRAGDPLALDASDEDRQLWEFVPHQTDDGGDFGFYYIRNKATGEYLYDNIDPAKELNLRQPNRGLDRDQNQSYPTTIAATRPPKNDRRYLWRIDPTETEIPDAALSLPQSGWTPQADKIAVLGLADAPGTPPSYTIVDSEGKTLYSGQALAWGKYWSNHTYYILNLNIPELEKEGDYKVRCNGLEADVYIRKEAMVHPFRQKNTDRFDLQEIFDPDFGFVTQWGRLTSWWPRAYDWLKSLKHWDWELTPENSTHNLNTFPHWMWRDIGDDNDNGDTYENLADEATREEAASCLKGGWDDTDTFAHNYAVDGQTLDELARLYRHTDASALHEKIYREILYGVYPILDRQEDDGAWRMGYMDQQHWSGTTAALAMGLAAVLPIVEERNTTLAGRIDDALKKSWRYMQEKIDDPESWPVPDVGLMHDGSRLKSYVGNQRTMWRESYLMLAVNLYLATREAEYKAAAEKEILAGRFAYNGWMSKDTTHPFAGQYSTNAIYALMAMLRFYDEASITAKAHIKKLARDFYAEHVVADTLLGGPFGNYSKRRVASPDGVDAWRVWEYMAAATQLYAHFGEEFGRGLQLAQRALDWYWGANPYAASLMQGVGTRFINYGWSSPHTLGRHMGLSAATVDGIPHAKGTDGGWAMSEVTVPSSIAVWNAAVLMQQYADHDWIRVYPKKSYRGAYGQLAAGRYTRKMLQAYGIDGFASIKVPKGYTLRLYPEDDFEGNATVVRRDRAELSGTYRSVEISYLPNAGEVVSVPEGTEITQKGEASQSTTLYNDDAYAAVKGIDTDTDTFTHTDLTTRGNYWRLRLDANYVIGKIEIVNRQNYGSRLDGCVVKVLDENGTALYRRKIQNAADGGTISLDLPEGTVGRYVKIGLEGDEKNGYGDYVVSFAELRLYAGKALIEDRDGDGVSDDDDAFPDDPAEWADHDRDGIGDNADSDDDNDGISDEKEEQYGFDPLDPEDADEDYDGDGVSNREEIIAGSDPTDPRDTRRVPRFPVAIYLLM